LEGEPWDWNKLKEVPKKGCCACAAYAACAREQIVKIKGITKEQEINWLYYKNLKASKLNLNIVLF